MSCLSIGTLRKIEKTSNISFNICQTNYIIYSFSGQLIKNIGTARLKCTIHNKITTNISFVIVNCECSIILGWNLRGVWNRKKTV